MKHSSKRSKPDSAQSNTKKPRGVKLDGNRVLVNNRILATIDCESDPFDGRTIVKDFIWGLHDGDQSLIFDDREEFVEYLRATPLHVYAHNGGKFDFHFLLPYIERDEEILIINGRIVKCRIGLSIIHDSYVLFPVPLRAFIKDDFNYEWLLPENRQKYRAEIVTYLKHDCEYLYQPLKRFLLEYGFHLTLASAAMKQLERIEGIDPIKTSRSHYQEFAPYYYGGRTQAFVKGEFLDGPYKMVDIKSAYPRAMQEWHPRGEKFRYTRTLPATDKEISRCFITLIARSTGAFPYRKEGGGLDFPDDGALRTFHVTGWEYLAARDCGLLQDATIQYLYQFDAPNIINFKKFVDHFYSAKDKAEETHGKSSYEYIVAKLYLNAPYGKTAANPEEYTQAMIVRGENVADWEEEGWAVDSVVGGDYLMTRPLPPHKQRFFDVVIGASITGWVRAYMLRALNAVEQPMYCDTDSILCKDHANLALGKNLGDWDSDGTFIRAWIGGKKMYALEYCPVAHPEKAGKYKTASKGVKLQPHEIKQVAKGGVVKYHPESPTFSVKLGQRYIAREVKMT